MKHEIFRTNIELITIGVMTLLKLKGIYLRVRTQEIEKSEDRLKHLRLFMGWMVNRSGKSIN